MFESHAPAGTLTFEVMDDLITGKLNGDPVTLKKWADLYMANAKHLIPGNSHHRIISFCFVH